MAELEAWCIPGLLCEVRFCLRAPFAWEQALMTARKA